MKVHFYKYQGCGNDFVIADNRQNLYSGLTREQVRRICDRHFGIGADGFMLLNLKAGVDFEMKYYNSDGMESSMCGNGGRCITSFAKKLGLIQTAAHFTAVDGTHHATIDEKNYVQLEMNDVNGIRINETFMQLDTGSPHYVHFTDYVNELDIKKEGALIRYSPLFKEEGINVNFVERMDDNSLYVRTYERGVEDETLSCGTGVTASAIASRNGLTGPQRVKVNTPGGVLEVDFTISDQNHVHSVILKGEALFVFSGEIEV